MSPLVLRLQALNAELFEPFGDVIEVADHNQVIPINYGLTERHHDLAAIDVAEAGGKAILSIFRSRPVQLPFAVKIMERHPKGSQAFMPLGGNPYVVVVAPAGELDPAKICAFIAQANQGVNYHKGTWHHYCLGLNSNNDFLVVDRGGEGDNCDEQTLPDNIELYVNH